MRNIRNTAGGISLGGASYFRALITHQRWWFDHECTRTLCFGKPLDIEQNVTYCQFNSVLPIEICLFLIPCYGDVLGASIIDKIGLDTLVLVADCAHLEATGNPIANFEATVANPPWTSCTTAVCSECSASYTGLKVGRM